MSRDLARRTAGLRGGRRAAHRLPERGDRSAYPAAARQPDLVLSVAGRAAGAQPVRALRRAGPGGHGPLRPAARSRPVFIPVLRPSPRPRRAAGRSSTSAPRRPGRARLGRGAGRGLGPPAPGRGPGHRVPGDPGRHRCPGARPNAPAPAAVPRAAAARTASGWCSTRTSSSRSCWRPGPCAPCEPRDAGGVPASVRRTGGEPPADADLGSGDPDRRRSGRRATRSRPPTPPGWRRSEVPKLFVNGEPGALLTGPSREECRRWPHQTEVTVPGAHFLPEDSSGPIGSRRWWRGWRHWRGERTPQPARRRARSTAQRTRPRTWRRSRGSGCRRCWPRPASASRRACRGADQRGPGRGERRGGHRAGPPGGPGHAT